LAQEFETLEVLVTDSVGAVDRIHATNCEIRAGEKGWFLRTRFESDGSVPGEFHAL
jgi:hypothetical protein